MNDEGSLFGSIIGFLLVAALFTFIGIDIHKELTVIDTRVETVDGKIYDCTEANSHTNGMTYIRKPYKIIIPTKSIKIITEIK